MLIQNMAILLCAFRCHEGNEAFQSKMFEGEHGPQTTLEGCCHVPLFVRSGYGPTYTFWDVQPNIR